MQNKKHLVLVTIIGLYVLGVTYPAYLQVNRWYNEVYNQMALDRVKLIEADLKMKDVTYKEDQQAPVGGARP